MSGGPCSGYPHLFEHKSQMRTGTQTIICIFCGEVAVPWTPAQIAELAATITPYRVK